MCNQLPVTSGLKSGPKLVISQLPIVSYIACFPLVLTYFYKVFNLIVGSLLFLGQPLINGIWVDMPLNVLNVV